MKKSQIIAILVAIIGILWVGSGVLFHAEHKQDEKSLVKGEQKPQEKVLPTVRIRESGAEDFADTVNVTGRTEGSRVVALSAEVSAQVLEILADKGHITKEGEVLAKLELKDREAKLREAEQRFQQRKIEFNAAKNLENRGFNSKVRLAQSRADLEEAKALLKNAKVALEKTTIIAPFDGVVDDRMIEIGDFVDTGHELFRIVDLDPLEIVGFVSEHDVQDIALGKTARIEFLNGQIAEGEVSFVSSEASSETRTFRVEISFDNPDYKIKAGLTSNLKIDARIKRLHKISPSALALNDIGQIGIKIVENNDTVRFYPVSIISDKADAMWVDGLPEKIRMITVGQHFVLDGQKVKPILTTSQDGLL